MQSAVTDIGPLKHARSIVVGAIVLLIGCFGARIAADLVLPAALARIRGFPARQAKADLVTLEFAAKGYAIEHQARFPISLNQLAAWGTERGVSVPTRDPWGGEYLYASPIAGLVPKLWSWGSDGKPGGAGDAADIDLDDALGVESR